MPKKKFVWPPKEMFQNMTPIFYSSRGEIDKIREQLNIQTKMDVIIFAMLNISGKAECAIKKIHIANANELIYGYDERFIIGVSQKGDLIMKGYTPNGTNHYCFRAINQITIDYETPGNVIIQAYLSRDQKKFDHTIDKSTSPIGGAVLKALDMPIPNTIHSYRTFDEYK